MTAHPLAQPHQTQQVEALLDIYGIEKQWKAVLAKDVYRGHARKALLSHLEGDGYLQLQRPFISDILDPRGEATRVSRSNEGASGFFEGGLQRTL